MTYLDPPLTPKGPSLEALLDALLMPAGLLDPEGRWLQVNRPWRTSAPVPPVLCPLLRPGDDWLSALGGPETDAGRALRAVLAGPESSRELELRHGPEDDPSWLRLRLSRVEGGPVLVILEDVSAENRAREALETSTAQLAAIVDNTPNVAIQVYNRAGRVVAWNRASERMYGFTAAEAVGRRLTELIFSAGEADKFDGILAGIDATGEPYGPYTWAFAAKDGRKGMGYSTVFPVPGPRQERRFICMDVDVTELHAGEAQRRALETQLFHSQKMEGLGRLAGGIAHDFNNLLTAILGSSELARLSLEPEHPSSELLGEITVAAQRANQLTKRLLTFARRQGTETRVVQMHDVLADADRLLRRLIGEHIELVTLLGEGVGPVRIDPGQLEQVLVNLVVNARDAMQGGGRITVETSALPPETHLPRGGVMLRVSDTGSGMTEEVQRHLFEPFFTTKGPGQGTGLGLATCYGIVTQAGGRISATSTLGSGSTFTILLPVSAAEPRREPTPRPVRERGRNELILVVEDEPLVRGLVEQILIRSGYRLLVAEGPSQALTLAEEHLSGLDLLLSDVLMPTMSGPSLATRLRMQRPDLQVLLMSGYAEDLPERELRGQRYGFISKPFTPEQLIAQVRATLDGRASIAPPA